MKRLIIYILAVIPLVSGCKKGDDAYDDPLYRVREVAWNSLSEQEKKFVIIDWKQAGVREITYEELSRFSTTIPEDVLIKAANDEAFSIYLVGFGIKDLSLGSYMVFVDKESKRVVGHALLN